jgi:hypothetical protein
MEKEKIYSDQLLLGDFCMQYTKVFGWSILMLSDDCNLVRTWTFDCPKSMNKM